jgi:hypothetical protein
VISNFIIQAPLNGDDVTLVALAAATLLVPSHLFHAAVVAAAPVLLALVSAPFRAPTEQQARIARSRAPFRHRVRQAASSVYQRIEPA